jgi:YD repeat-containing protein
MSRLLCVRYETFESFHLGGQGRYLLPEIENLKGARGPPHGIVLVVVFEQDASGATTKYTWSAEDQLVGIAFPDGTISTYKI